MTFLVSMIVGCLLFISLHLGSIVTELKGIARELELSWIMSDALEFGLEPDVVDVWLESNYINHYGKTLAKTDEESK